MEGKENTTPALELRHISKSFPGVKALSDVSFAVEKGKVHVLVGENGAGKSTLIKIINGIYSADEGEIFMFGEKIAHASPKLMREKGIATIHQELSPVRDLTIAENIFLGREPQKKSRFIDWKKLYSDAQQLIDEFGFGYKARTKMRELTVSDMQIIEIIKAVSMNAKVVIMDEPTSSITEGEVRTLFKQVNRLRDSGISIIYITHKMDEIMEIGDDASILRDGQLISTHKVQDLTKDQIITKMVGRQMKDVYPVKTAVPGEIVLELKNLNKKGSFENINLSLRKGEILGMAGLVGAGRTEVFRTVFGLDQLDSGEILYEGKPLNVTKTRDAIHAGIMMVSEDRKGEGLVLCRSVGENIALPNLNSYAKAEFINKKKEKADSTEMKETLNIKTPTLDTPAGSLSGGNQQKIVIAKWLLHKPKVLIMDEPTRGIDVGARYEIYKIMCDLAEQGVGIVMISSDLPEIIGICDRAIIMSEGHITGEVPRNEFSQEYIMSFAVGGNN
ncbi:sugar ABC transporter ATP-binding protein [Ruminococcus gauvreauii]|uniref:sugar ABC transporter ATP-binding protein n=1 Tax=Ruminococcus gauvreauii TaxID=438033 RepID=UPI003983FAA5